MKQLKDFTLKEFYRYTELIANEPIDIYSVFRLFGLDIEKLSVAEMQKYEMEIATMTVDKGKGVNRVYKINGRKFKAVLNMTKVNAAQFIDFQTYVKNFKIQEVLSVFLIPMKRNWYGKWKTQKYNTGYDIFEVQDFLYANFKIGEANDLSAFFLKQSESLLKVMMDYLAKKEMKTKLKLLKAQLKTR